MEKALLNRIVLFLALLLILGCKGSIEPKKPSLSLECPDQDFDGFFSSECGGLDCDDGNSFIYPGASEICDNTIDEDCNGRDLECDCFDNDMDKSFNEICGGNDCNDDNPLISPLEKEGCDFIDNNCDGIIDEGFDLDNDGYKTCENDCNDKNVNVSPGVIEVCDGLDNNCDGSLDSEEIDNDSDGYMVCANDCDDNDSLINPSAVELCDGIDNNCEGKIDEGFDLDNDGFTTCEADCDDQNPNSHDYLSCPVYFGGAQCITILFCESECPDNPAEISCDGLDQNCDETDYCPCEDEDGDGFDCAVDCNDSNVDINPGAPEFCYDGIDNDCDFLTDSEEELICYSHEETMLYYSFRNEACDEVLEICENYPLGGIDPGIDNFFHPPYNPNFYSYDYSGWNNHSSLDQHSKMGKWMTDGIIGDSLYFDCEKNFVEVPYSDSFEISDSITVETWIKPLTSCIDDGYPRSFIAGVADPPIKPISLHKDDNGDIYFAIQDTDQNSFNVRFNRSLLTPDNEEYYAWNHIVGTYNGATLKIYLNGELQESKSKPVSGFGTLGFSASRGDVLIGAAPYENSSEVDSLFFVGKIDDTRIYNRALDETEILDNYNGGFGTNSPVSSGLKLSLTFESSEEQILPDEILRIPDHSGTGNYAYLKNYYFLEYHENDPDGGNHNGVVEFRQPDRTKGISDYIRRTVPYNCGKYSTDEFCNNMNFWYNDETQEGGELSIVVWVKAKEDGSGSLQPIIHNSRISDHWSYHNLWFGLYIDETDRFLFRMPMTSECYNEYTIDLISVNPYVDNQWHLVVGTYKYKEEESLISMSLYVDGYLENSFVHGVESYCAGYNGSHLGDHIMIGNDFLYFGDSHNFFSGYIDEIALYKKTLSQNEVRALYNNYNK